MTARQPWYHDVSRQSQYSLCKSRMCIFVN